MTKSSRKNVPDVGIELGAARMPSELASDRATAPGYSNLYALSYIDSFREGSRWGLLYYLLL